MPSSFPAPAWTVCLAVAPAVSGGVVGANVAPCRMWQLQPMVKQTILVGLVLQVL